MPTFYRRPNVNHCESGVGLRIFKAGRAMTM